VPLHFAIACVMTLSCVSRSLCKSCRSISSRSNTLFKTSYIDLSRGTTSVLYREFLVETVLISVSEVQYIVFASSAGLLQSSVPAEFRQQLSHFIASCDFGSWNWCIVERLSEMGTITVDIVNFQGRSF